MSGQALPRGAKVGTYEIQRVLGEGAFGITYLAMNALGQKRSIKEFFPNGYAQRSGDGNVVPNSGLGEKYQLALSRFSTEAKTVSELDHPHIVKGVDFFSANDTASFVMPYYEGVSLDQFTIDGETLEPSEARHLTDRLSDALGYIHQRGLVHRDIKPANIFIVEDTGEPILIDFGAARLSETVSDAAGSEHYRAPEQTGEMDTQVSAATDIYGLSATLYRLITGVLPVDAQARLQAVKAGQLDPLQYLSSNAKLAQDFGDGFLKNIENGLKLEPSDRPARINTEMTVSADSTSDNFEAAGHSQISAEPPGQATQNYGYSIEPEGRPVLRYAVFGTVLTAIVAGGIYLAVSNMDFNAAPKTQQEETPKVEAAPIDTEQTPAAPKRLSPAQAWVKALELDTLEGYREYLESFPAGANADKARAEIRRFDDEAFENASSIDSISAYQSYISDFPKGAHVAEAKASIKAIQNARAAAQRKAAQEKAAATNTADGYQNYLNAYPAGANAAEARSRLDTINAKSADDRAFNAAKYLNTKTAYQTYISSYPQGQHVPAAMKAIDDLTPRAGGNLKDCDVCPPLTILPSGGFQQGAGPDDRLARSSEKPERRVDFTNMFAVGVTEVTFAQWNACVSGGGCQAVSDQGWGGGTRPVINVTWGQATAYTDWLSQKTGERYSLPSESQWEYAARAGEIRAFLGGTTQGVCVFANGAGKESGASWANPDCQDPAGDRTMPVGSLAANKFGLKDVLGNVAEWTLDCGSLNYRDSPADGSPNMRGSCRQRITRGGSWFSGPRDMRLSSRAPMRQDDKNEFTGFRVVRAVKN